LIPTRVDQLRLVDGGEWRLSDAPTLNKSHDTDRCVVCGQIRGGGSAIIRSVSRRINSVIDNEIPLFANIGNEYIDYCNWTTYINTINENSHTEHMGQQLCPGPSFHVIKYREQ